MPALYQGFEPQVVAATDATGATAVPLGTSTTRVSLQNLGPDPVFFRGSTAVTTANGFRVASGETLAFGKESQVLLDLYFVTGAGLAADVRILEEA